MKKVESAVHFLIKETSRLNRALSQKLISSKDYKHSIKKSRISARKLEQLNLMKAFCNKTDTTASFFNRVTNKNK